MEYKISSAKITIASLFSLIFLLGLSTFFLVGLLVILKAGLTSSVLGVGLAVVFGWSLILYTATRFIASLRNYVVLNSAGIRFSQFGRTIEIPWNEIKTISLQLIIAKRLGVWESNLYLSITLTEQAKLKLEKVKVSREFGFIQNRTTLEGYMGNYKPDLAITLKFLKEKDKGLLVFLKKQQSYIDTAPIVKTKSVQEYADLAKASPRN